MFLYYPCLAFVSIFDNFIKWVGVESFLSLYFFFFLNYLEELE